MFALLPTLPLVPGLAYAQTPAPPVVVPPVPAGAAALPIPDQLMYCTTRLEFPVAGGTRTGTAFNFSFFRQGNYSVPALVSNSHVFADSDVCNMTLLSAGPDGLPNLGRNIQFSLEDIQKRIIRHPTLDLTILPMASVLEQLSNSGKRPFSIQLDQSVIPDDGLLKSLTALEPVLTVGYPGNFWDNVNNLPLFHRGYTSTSPLIDFQGRPEFLVDFSTLPGASGSPMFLFQENGWFDARTHSTMLGGSRIALLGVVYGVGEQVDDQIFIVDAPTKIDEKPKLTKTPLISVIPTNLGACIRSAHILDFEPILVAGGLVPPVGYKMRANPAG